MNTKTIENLKVGNKFVIVPKTKHTFSMPEEFIVESITIEESTDPYHPFDRIYLRNKRGLVLEFDSDSMNSNHKDYDLYDSFQEWYKQEIKKVEEKKQTYLLAKKYTEDCDEFFKRFSKDNPEKLI